MTRYTPRDEIAAPTPSHRRLESRRSLRLRHVALEENLGRHRNNVFRSQPGTQIRAGRPRGRRETPWPILIRYSRGSSKAALNSRWSADTRQRLMVFSLVTQDIDICCPFTTGNLLRLQEAIADLRPVHRLTPQRIPLHLTRENCAGLQNLYLGTDLGPLDCFERNPWSGGLRSCQIAHHRTPIPCGTVPLPRPRRADQSQRSDGSIPATERPFSNSAQSNSSAARESAG